jgi:hypothetical protein
MMKPSDDELRVVATTNLPIGWDEERHAWIWLDNNTLLHLREALLLQHIFLLHTRKDVANNA